MKTRLIGFAVCLTLAVGVSGSAQEFQPGLGSHSSILGQTLPMSGGLHFTMLTRARQAGDAWPVLTAYTSPFILNWRGGPPFCAPLGKIMCGDAQPTGCQLTEGNWCRQTYRYLLPNGQSLEVTLSRLSPAVLLKTDAGQVSLLDIRTFIGGGFESPYAGLRGEEPEQLKQRLTQSYNPSHYQEQGGRFDIHLYPQHIAIPGKGGMEVSQAPCVIQGARLSEPWLLVWFARGSHLVDDADCPMLVRLQTRPEAIELSDKAGLLLRFPRSAGYVSLLSLYGFRYPKIGETEAWNSGLPQPVAEHCRRWAGILQHYPLSVEESFSVNRAADVVAVRNRFAFLDINDEWASQGEKVAPLPPILGAAYEFGLPVRLPDGAIELGMAENCGPLIGVPRADQYTYELRGLVRYIREAATVANIAPEAQQLRETLEAEVRRMLAAGHLRPSFFCGGLQDGKTTFDFWACPSELVYTLSEAYPFLLSDDVRRQTKEYLVKEMEAFPPWRIGHVGFANGVSRDAYDIPPEEMSAELRSTSVVRYWQPQGPPSLDVLYSMWSYGHHTGDWETVRAAMPSLDGIFQSHLAGYDWAIMGLASAPAGPLTVLNGLTGAHSHNTVAAGVIGYARLLEELGGDPAQRDLASYLAAKVLLARCVMARYRSFLEKHAIVPKLADLPEATRLEQSVYQLLELNYNYALLTDVVPSKKHFEFSLVSLMPEVGRALRDLSLEDVRQYVSTWELRDPYWFVPRSPDARGEASPMPYTQYWTVFQAKAQILGESGANLERYIQCPAALGDLYYIQNITAAIRAYSNPGWQFLTKE